MSPISCWRVVAPAAARWQSEVPSGAARPALLRQCLVESSLLSLLGGCAGAALAVSLVAGLRNYGPAGVPRLHEVTLHPTALLFTLGLSVLTTVLFGFMPAWRLSHVAPQAFLKDGVQAGSSRKQPAPAERGCDWRDRPGDGSAGRWELAGAKLSSCTEHAAGFRSQGRIRRAGRSSTRSVIPIPCSVSRCKRICWQSCKPCRG